MPYSPPRPCGVIVRGTTFILQAPGLSYIISVDAGGDLVHDHFGARAAGARTVPNGIEGWSTERGRREFPDAGRGDFRLPAIHLAHGAAGAGAGGHTVSHFVYESHEVIPGKRPLEGLPATFAGEDEAETLLLHLRDRRSGVGAVLSYTVFADLPVVTRSFTITNGGTEPVTIERAASLSLDMPSVPLDMLHHYGSWGKEALLVRRKVEHGTQGFQSVTGYSSHLHNPFFALADPATTETHGEVWGFNLVYSGSFSAEVEKCARGYTRALLGLHSLHLSWPLAPGETFTAPEVVAVYSGEGLGGMSRAFHRLYRRHLIPREWALQRRPVLLNNWEATHFDMDAERLYPIAAAAAKLGVRLFVMDDGWFGDAHARTSDHAGLGDWMPNPRRFPGGLKPFVDRVTALDLKDPAGEHGGKLQFGIWVEPEMVNPASELYERHPEWVLRAPGHEPTTSRNQLVLDLGQRAVQEYVLDAVTRILECADIRYVKWDLNRGIHELPHPAHAHAYVLGMYRVIEALRTRFPRVLWEGCASGGGRIDPGLLAYWPQHWASDNTDARDRIALQLGLSLMYPASALGCHVSAVPQEHTHRTTPLAFRTHVALMGGGFGFELDPTAMPAHERAQIPRIVALAERINPLILAGDMYRLTPTASNWPAVQFLAEDGASALVFLFQIADAHIHDQMSPLRLQGLNPAASYTIRDPADGFDLDHGPSDTYSGAELLHVGLTFLMQGDYQSKLLHIARI